MKDKETRKAAQADKRTTITPRTELWMRREKLLEELGDIEISFQEKAFSGTLDGPEPKASTYPENPVGILPLKPTLTESAQELVDRLLKLKCDMETIEQAIFGARPEADLPEKMNLSADTVQPLLDVALDTLARAIETQSRILQRL